MTLGEQGGDSTCDKVSAICKGYAGLSNPDPGPILGDLGEGDEALVEEHSSSLLSVSSARVILRLPLALAVSGDAQDGGNEVGIQRLLWYEGVHARLQRRVSVSVGIE